MKDQTETRLPDLLMQAMQAGIIDRYCVDPANVRFWQGNLRLQFGHEEATQFLNQLLDGFQSAAAQVNVTHDENW